MKILIIGACKMGQKIVKTMSLEDCEITVVDSEEKVLAEINANSKVKTVLGNGLDRSLLKKLDVEDFDFVVSLTSSDKINILICTMAKNLGAKFTIALIEQADSIDELFYLRDSLGIDYIINPDLEIARTVEKIVKDKLVYQSDSFGKGKIEVVGHYVENDIEFEDEKIKDIGSIATLLIVAVQRGNELIIPNGDTVIKKYDYLYLMGLSNDIMSFKMKYFRFEPKQEKEKIVIVGGGGVSKKIAEMIDDYNITIVERDYEKVVELRKKYPNLFVVKRDFMGADFLKDEEIDDVDVFIALTDNDELNIVLGMMAKKTSIPQVMIKLDTMGYSQIIDGLDFTAVLNPITLSANKIIRKLRDDRTISTQLVFNGEAEISEIQLLDSSELIGKSIADISLPKGILIGGITRENNTAVIPRGNSKIEKGDTLVVFYKSENRRQLEKFVSPNSGKSFLEKFFM
ncbi:trk system potassium uptake protein TrkA [Anaerosphaera aminiphila DSM 21120]|uniref:Trk system potassium uptake protein TrkA n=1 Tax=Anaerosphaera aminiphila DSM 21120 TaxID=1120995 RepID=A0A1M5Q9D8_9FIRM|nr:Trk system potassium transporter TrkA [Anaerosphaera aminiphila]SHH10451.1 trk system potassium uptake protein TrkA [Anaerosphaera aminiphila DSM 21120]